MKLKSTIFEPIDAAKGWYATADPEHDSQPLEKLALDLQADALAKGFYCLCGMKEYEGYHLYLAPAIGVRSIVEAFEVGSHGGDDASSVIEQISAADAANPLIPYFADPAGLKAKFSKRVTPQLVALLEQTVCDAETMMSDDGSIGEFVMTNQGIHLWWD